LSDAKAGGAVYLTIVGVNLELFAFAFAS